MMRSFVVALVTIAAVIVLGSSEQLTATSQQPGSFSYPVDIVGGTPGVNIEIFLNNGKVGDAPVGTSGDATWVLDLSNVGKTRVTVYVDVCKDGKVVKVAFVTGGGQAPPEDEGCDRRIGGVGWWSDCGVTRITLNIRTWGARVIGCGSMYTRPQFLIPVGAVVGTVPFLFGGSDGPAAIAAPPSAPIVTSPPVTAPPVTTPAPTNTTNPNPTSPTPPATPEFTVTITVTAWDHVAPGQFSDACGRFTTNPARPNAPFTSTAAGAGVTQPSVSGTTNAAGVGVFRHRINQFGAVSFTVSVVSGGVTRTATGNTNVTGASNSCPNP